MNKYHDADGGKKWWWPSSFFKFWVWWVQISHLKVSRDLINKNCCLHHPFFHYIVEWLVICGHRIAVYAQNSKVVLSVGFYVNLLLFTHFVAIGIHFIAWVLWVQSSKWTRSDYTGWLCIHLHMKGGDTGKKSCYLMEILHCWTSFSLVLFF